MIAFLALRLISSADCKLFPRTTFTDPDLDSAIIRPFCASAFLRIKLPFLNDYCNARRKAARYYNNAFKSMQQVITPKMGNGCEFICENCDCHVFHQYTLQILNGQRNELHQHLLDNGIPNAIYYPVPLHSQKAYMDERYNEDDFKVTNEIIDTVISLPMHTELDDEQLAFITKTINDFVS